MERLRGTADRFMAPKNDFKIVDEYIALATCRRATGTCAPAFRQELSPYKISKGTIRFPLSEAVPVQLIARIAKFRSEELA